MTLSTVTQGASIEDPIPAQQTVAIRQLAKSFDEKASLLASRAGTWMETKEGWNKRLDALQELLHATNGLMREIINFTATL